jgi:hypothetical protein
MNNVKLCILNDFINIICIISSSVFLNTFRSIDLCFVNILNVLEGIRDSWLYLKVNTCNLLTWRLIGSFSSIIKIIKYFLYQDVQILQMKLELLLCPTYFRWYHFSHFSHSTQLNAFGWAHNLISQSAILSHVLFV